MKDFFSLVVVTAQQVVVGVRASLIALDFLLAARVVWAGLKVIGNGLALKIEAALRGRSVNMLAASGLADEDHDRQ